MDDSTNSTDLAAIFDENAKIYDIAGFASFPHEEEFLQQQSAVVRDLLFSSRTNLRRDQKAAVLFVLIRIAQRSYERGKFWPSVDELFSETVTLNRRPLLCDWFECALAEFGYPTVEDDRALRISPIIMHAGIPDDSLSSLLQFVHGRMHLVGASPSPSDLAFYAENHPQLHANVQRIFEQQLNVSIDIWDSFMGVIEVHQHGQFDRHDEAYENMPPSIDQQRLEEEIVDLNLNRPARGQVHAIERQPEFFYDAFDGAVRIRVFGEDSSNWTANLNGTLYWRTGLTVANDPKYEAEVVSPLLEDLEMTSQSSGHVRRFELVYGDDNVRTIWFKSHNGRLFQRTEIEKNGVDPGDWYLATDGELECEGSSPGVFNWSFREGNWKLSKVHIPERTEDRKKFEIAVDGNVLEIPLSRRPRPKLEFLAGGGSGRDIEITDCAVTWNGESVRLFTEPPIIKINSQRPTVLAIHQFKDDNFTSVQRARVEPQQSIQVPQPTTPTLYKISNSQTKLSQLITVIPGMEINGPEYTADQEKAFLDVRPKTFPFEAGQPDQGKTSLGQRKGWLRATSPTSEPFLVVNCTVDRAFKKHVEISWPLEGIRWRVLHVKGTSEQWTKNLVYVDKEKISPESNLEVMVPDVDFIRINGGAGGVIRDLQRAASGRRALVPLLPFKGNLRAEIGGDEYGLLYIADRPVLESFDVAEQNDAYVVTWSGFLPDESELIIWEALNPGHSFTSHKIDPGARRFEMRKTDCGFGSPLAFSIGIWRRDFFCNQLELAREKKTGRTEISYCPFKDTEFSDRAKYNTLQVARECYGRLFAEHWDPVETRKHLSEKLKNGKEIDWKSLIDFAGSLEDASDFLGDSLKGRCNVISSAVLEQLNSRGLREFLIGCQSRDDYFDWLKSGINVSWIKFEELREDHRWDGEAPFPLDYYHRMFLISDQSICRAQDGKSLEKTKLPLRLNCVSGIEEFHSVNKMPRLQCFVPLSGSVQGTSIVAGEHLFNRVRVDLVDVPLDSRLGFAILNLRAIDPAGIDLTWRPNVSSGAREFKPGWTVEKDGQIVAAAGMSPFRTEAADPGKVAPIVRRFFAIWAGDMTGSCPDLLDPGTRELIDLYLPQKTGYGDIYGAVWEPTEKENIEPVGEVSAFLQGDQATVMLDCWRIAWVDRFAAHMGITDMFGQGSKTCLEQRDFLNHLQRSLQREPAIMKRMLALTELLFRTFFGGGIGVAVKYQPISSQTSGIHSD